MISVFNRFGCNCYNNLDESWEHTSTIYKMNANTCLSLIENCCQFLLLYWLPSSLRAFWWVKLVLQNHFKNYTIYQYINPLTKTVARSRARVVDWHFRFKEGKEGRKQRRQMRGCVVWQKQTEDKLSKSCMIKQTSQLDHVTPSLLKIWDGAGGGQACSMASVLPEQEWLRKNTVTDLLWYAETDAVFLKTIISVMDVWLWFRD